MVELRQVGAGQDGIHTLAALPFSVGRKGNDLVLESPGIWERHVVIEKGKDRRYLVVPQPPATVVLGGKSLVEPTPLHNGDVLEVGSLQLQFRISATKQRHLATVETLTWLGLGCLAMVQVGLALSW